MVIPNEIYKNIYTGNDVASVFAYTFKIHKNIDIEVTEVLIATGAETLLALTTDYTVSGVGEVTGGNVTLVAGALPSTKQLVINLKPELLQETDYKEHDPFPAETHETALDKIVNITKSQQEVLDRSVQSPITETTPLTIPALVAGKVLSNDGGALLWSTITATDYNGSMIAGLDASKAAVPAVNDIYIATDTKRVYICFVAGTWTITNYENGLDASKSASPSVGNIYFATDTEILYKCVTASVWEPFTMQTVEQIFTETAHGFVAKDVVRFDGINWVKAQADSLANSEYSWIVVKSLTANTFKAVLSGYISGLSGLVAGTDYFLDDDTAGLLTSTEPTDIGDVSKPMLLALTTTTGIVLNHRGIVVPGIHTTPIFWNMLTAEPDVVGQGTWVYVLTADADLYNGIFFNSSDTDGDNFTCNFRCPAGTYTLRFNAPKAAVRAIVDVDIDGSEEGSFDLNGAIDPINIEEISGLVLSAGEHTIKFRIDGKTGTNYFFAISGIILQKTA